MPAKSLHQHDGAGQVDAHQALNPHRILYLQGCDMQNAGAVHQAGEGAGFFRDAPEPIRYCLRIVEIELFQPVAFTGHLAKRLLKPLDVSRGQHDSGIQFAEQDGRLASEA